MCTVGQFRCSCMGCMGCMGGITLSQAYRLSALVPLYWAPKLWVHHHSLQTTCARLGIFVGLAWVTLLQWHTCCDSALYTLRCGNALCFLHVLLQSTTRCRGIALFVDTFRTLALYIVHCNPVVHILYHVDGPYAEWDCTYWWTPWSTDYSRTQA